MLDKKQKVRRKKVCGVCGEYFIPYRDFQPACKHHEFEYAMKMKAGKIEQARMLTGKQKKAEQSKANQARKASSLSKREFNRSDLSWQHEQTQKSFNKMRVLQELKWFYDRGIKPYCISCGKEKGNDAWCAGHFKTRGAHSELRYDHKNVFLQHNQRCNMRLSGDIHGARNRRGYLKGIVMRFGEVEGNAIIEHCEAHQGVRKYTCEELEQMRKEFNAEIRRLKSDMEMAQ